MEAGQITYTATVNYVTLETTTTAYVLEESAGDRIVTESGSNGSTGKFTNNETITGNISIANSSSQRLGKGTDIPTELKIGDSISVTNHEGSPDTAFMQTMV